MIIKPGLCEAECVFAVTIVLENNFVGELKLLSRVPMRNSLRIAQHLGASTLL